MSFYCLIEFNNNVMMLMKIYFEMHLLCYLKFTAKITFLVDLLIYTNGKIQRI